MGGMAQESHGNKVTGQVTGEKSQQVMEIKSQEKSWK